MFYVYIIYSLHWQRYYVGSAEDIEKRLQQHNAGKSASTRSGVPWKLIHSETFETRSAAVTHERKIKARGIGRYLADMGHIPSG